MSQDWMKRVYEQTRQIQDMTIEMSSKHGFVPFSGKGLENVEEVCES